jgi:sucrose phosphorylase
MKLSTASLKTQILHHLDLIYEDVPQVVRYEPIASTLLKSMRLSSNCSVPTTPRVNWTEKDVVLITYGDSIQVSQNEENQKQVEKPLKTLKKFLDDKLKGVINSVHILPFYPYSSDDGFAVINYVDVNETLGAWEDIRSISSDYRLMADLVLNHCSSRSLWFLNFVQNKTPGRGYFYTADPEDDLSQVVRPRTSPLLRDVNTLHGVKQVWCTFSHDQVDLDFRNPDVLIEFVNIIRRYLDEGIRLFRLDAVVFLWKKLGTRCINLEQTHEIIRLLRTLIEAAQPDAVLITETNIPNQENLAYFGNGNEAHAIYNFSLPPLLVNTLIRGDCHHLKQWMMSMPPARVGTTYFNFIASHDGIGLRPLEGLLTEEEVELLTRTMHTFGGHISMRALGNGKSKPYEINISLFDALQGTVSGRDKFGIARFICAHAIMFGMEGIPGLYIHSLLGTQNDQQRVERSGQNRAINRHRWNQQQLMALLDDQSSHHHQIFQALVSLLKIRQEQPAFHPDAQQYLLHFNDNIFGYWRQTHDLKQSIYCISNISDKPQYLALADINLNASEQWKDLINGQMIPDFSQIQLIKPYQTIWLTNWPH